MREVLYREAYRGMLVWNKTRKRDRWGQKRPTDRPASEWMRVADDSLRIVSDTLWNAAHTRLAERRENYRLHGWQAPDGRGVRRHHLLSGFARCAACGGSMQAVSTSSTTSRLFRYVCASYWNRGRAVCANGRMARMEVADAAIRAKLACEVLRPSVIERALDQAVAALQTDRRMRGRASRRAQISRRLAALGLELANLAEVAAAKGAVPAVLTALLSKESERTRLASELDALRDDETNRPALQPAALRRELHGYLDEWQRLAEGNVAETRGLLQTLLRNRIVFRATTAADGSAAYELTLPIAFERLLSMVVPSLQVRVASQSIPSWNQIVSFLKDVEKLRQAGLSPLETKVIAGVIAYGSNSQNGLEPRNRCPLISVRSSTQMRGGRRPRRYIVPGAVPVWVSSGRWGPRRARVEQCVAALAAELVYDDLIRAGTALTPGWCAVRRWTPKDGSGRTWEISIEVVANAVWRCGRLFLRCPNCDRWATRLYVPAEGLEPRCRRCWGLSYESQSWSYKPVGIFGRVLGPIAYATTHARRHERRQNAFERYKARRLLQGITHTPRRADEEGM